MSANDDGNGKLRQLGTRAEPDEEITAEQVKDAPRMARLLMRILRDVALLKRRWAPRRIDFAPRAVVDDGVTVYRFPHRFGGAVRWWVVDWTSMASWPALIRLTSSDENTLELVSLAFGTVTIRVEEAG